MTTKTEPTVLDTLYAKRQKVVDEWSAAVEKRETERAAFEARADSADDKPTETEVQSFKDAEGGFTAANDQYKAKIAEYDERITDQLDMQKRRDEAAAQHKGIIDEGDTKEPLFYSRESGKGPMGRSYYRDLACAFGPGNISFQTTDRAKSTENLRRHAMEMDVEIPKRMKARKAEALRKAREAEQSEDFNPFQRGRQQVIRRDERWANPFEYRVEPNLAQGDGGYFVPPLWLPDEFIPQLVAHLVAAGLCRQLDLPPGTDSINIPKISTGTAVGYQQANNAGVLTQDWTDTSVQANVKTIAGESDVALQLLEQSPHGLVDEVITMNLMQQYNAFKDQQVLAGDGLNTAQLNGGHLLGLYPFTNWSGMNTIVYTASSPAPYTFPQVLGAMASQVSRNRFDAEGYKVVMHGRRWFWYSTGLDGNDRPLGETMAGGRFNIAAALQSGLQAEGLVGTLPFLADVPCYIDNNVPTTDSSDSAGAGTADVAYAGLWDDAWLFEGDLRTNVYREVLSSSLGVRFQIYNYAAFLVRYGQSFAGAYGTGFSAPAGTTTSVLF